ncbi:MAG: RHS repeat-associated core domain-containing protein [Thermodesulfobacteriota bacterium]|nr:RHS repeat-associated core domain-containing protein [Thermodesulfobacteriota bacterium]
MEARYYDPQVGRFISEDPIGFAGGDVNLYAYVSNNPVMFVDPDGEFLQSIIAGGVAGSIVGGITFVAELAKGSSVTDAAKSAVISGATSAISVGLASTGAGFLVAGSAATATNAALQKVMNGDVNLRSALLSALPPSAGGVLLGKAGLQGVAQGVVTGLISGPSSIAGNAFFPSNSQASGSGK